MAELRRVRASFTSTLEKICLRLDAKSDASIAWDMVGLRFASQFSLQSLWVVGSYARGAPDCGDLDLVAEVSVESHKFSDGTLSVSPPGRRVAKVLFNSPKDVPIYIGTPQTNESGAAFPEAILIWQGPAHDWQAAIASIQADTTAGHFERPTDQIPFRPEQLNSDIEEFENLVQLESQQILQWKFMPLGQAAPTDSFNQDELEFANRIKHNCGLKTQKLIPYLVTFFRQASWPALKLRANFDKSMFSIGSAKVLVGCPKIPIEELNSVSTSSLLIIPHESARGPNGIWVIERGDAHPLVQATNKLPIYALFDVGEHPWTSFFFGENDDNYTPHHSLAVCGDLFTTEKAAQKIAQSFAEDGETPVAIKALNPSELRSYLARLDILFIDDQELALTWRGKTSLQTSAVATSTEVINAMTRHSRASRKSKRL